MAPENIPEEHRAKSNGPKFKPLEFINPLSIGDEVNLAEVYLGKVSRIYHTHDGNEHKSTDVWIDTKESSDIPQCLSRLEKLIERW